MNIQIDGETLKKIAGSKFCVIANGRALYPDDIFDFCQKNDLEIIGLNLNRKQCGQVQGMPGISTLAGPMFDGEFIRYEAGEVYKMFSV